jgi:hypothetical protein
VNDDDKKGNERGIGKKGDFRANSSEYSQERGVSRFRFVTPWPGNFWNDSLAMIIDAFLSL